MFLKREHDPPLTAGDKASPASDPPAPAEEERGVLGELVSSLSRRRTYREMTLELRSGIRDAAAEFSFLRLRGLQSLLKALRSVALNDASLALFRHSQLFPELQVVPVIFNNSLRQTKDEAIANLDHIFGVEPMKVKSPASDCEVALALRVLEGCCLLHKESKTLAKRHDAIKVLIKIISTRGALEQGACLDAFISLLVDCPANQTDFDSFRGIEKVADLIKDEQADESVRLKCGEFLLLLMGHIYGREKSPLASIHDDMRRLLGEKCASLIWAASQFGSTLDPEQRQTALHIQARRVLESLELYSL